jgi:hypothetical protein
MIRTTMDFERARERIRAAYKRIDDEKRSKRTKVITIDKVAGLLTTAQPLPKTKNAVCQAMCLSGKKCTFKATSPCGKFCKKHIIVHDG